MVSTVYLCIVSFETEHERVILKTFQVNKMELEELDNGAFLIHSLDTNKPKQTFMCRAPEARKQQWIATLSRILQFQRSFGEALENPAAYLRELHREPARDPAA